MIAQENRQHILKRDAAAFGNQPADRAPVIGVAPVAANIKGSGKFRRAFRYTRPGTVNEKDDKMITRAHARHFPALADIWERAVRHTHTFLCEAEIARLRVCVQEMYLPALPVWCWQKENGKCAGFVGVLDEKIEMLFVEPQVFGRGIGKALLTFACEQQGARFVDVNEQNPSAIAFYEHMGFVHTGRSPLDGEGQPYPLLHMQRR